MFYIAMFKFLKKKLFPKALLTRMLLIIIVPTILAQVISTYIFYNKHWDNVSRYIIYTLSNEISLIVNAYEILPKRSPLINKYTFLRYQFTPGKQIIQEPVLDLLPEEIRILKRNVDYNLPNRAINVIFNKKTKEVEIEIGGVSGGALSFYINHKKVFVQSTYTFILWMVGSTLILLVITAIFAKNQIKSITRLSIVADKLAKGLSVRRFIPYGATEVRNVGYAFLKMKEKVEDEVKRKAQMLAWVSHDLRTPLTRMKLQLAIGGKDQIQLLKADICELEKIISDYLDFVKGEADIKISKINLTKLMTDAIKVSSMDTKTKFHFKADADIYINANENQFKRAMANLLDNAKRFGTKVKIELKDMNKEVIIEIHDNGPGIPEQDLKDVFKPFYRGNSYNNMHTKGSGLGLPIVQNIIRKHLGTITLTRSKKEGGLMVVISIPKTPNNLKAHANNKT